MSTPEKLVRMVRSPEAAFVTREVLADCGVVVSDLGDPPGHGVCVVAHGANSVPLCRSCMQPLVVVCQESWVVATPHAIRSIEVDGEDVTNRCHKVGFDSGGRVDDGVREGLGAVFLWKRCDEGGGLFATRHGELIQEIREGDIRVTYDTSESLLEVPCA